GIVEDVDVIQPGSGASGSRVKKSSRCAELSRVIDHSYVMMPKTSRGSEINERIANSPCVTVFNPQRPDIASVHVEKRSAIERITTLPDRIRSVCLIGARVSSLPNYPLASSKPTTNANHLAVVIPACKIVDHAILNEVAFRLWSSRGGGRAEAESFPEGCFVSVDVNKMHVGDFVTRSRQRNAERAKICIICGNDRRAIHID